MSDQDSTPRPARGAPTTISSCLTPADRRNDDKVICERCGAAEMYRMHAVWRCPACGYKTDCCGW